MGFKSVLKTVGEDVVKAAEGVVGSPKVIVESVTQDSTDIKTLFSIPKTVEGMFAASKIAVTGDQKLAAAIPYVNSLVQDVEILGGSTIGSLIQNETEFNAGITALANAVVQILNACGK
jgi:hypothetical protein